MDENVVNDKEVAAEKGEVLSTLSSSSLKESSVGNVSIRGLVCILLVLGVIIYPFFKIDNQTVSMLAVSAVSYYFGKMQSK